MSYFKILFSLIYISSFLSCSSSSEESGKPKILVSIAPYHTMIKRIVGDHADVQIVVPPGTDSHSYEPTSRQMINFGHADIWFQIGDHFESKMTPVLRANNPELRISDLREGIQFIHAEKHKHEHGHSCVGHDHDTDIHIWMSPKRMKKQIQTIFEVLSQVYPQHADDFYNGYNAVIGDLIDLDTRITDLLSPLRNRTVLVSHNAYAYFADDYGLNILAIECEGKEAGSRYITSLLSKAQRHHISTVFAQEGLHKKGAERFSEDLGVDLHFLDPYHPHYFRNMWFIAQAFHKECSS